jgi:hypothetical protein
MNARLRRTRLEHSSLVAAQLTGAYLHFAHLAEANLGESRLERAALYEAQMAGANLYGADLTGADLRGAIFDSATNFKYVKLGDGHANSVRVADLRWGGTNLAVVDWSCLTARGAQLGDEYVAHSWDKQSFSPSAENLSEQELAEEQQKFNQQKKQERLEAYRAAVRANRQLATALREQGMNEEADAFAYRAQDAQRSVFAQQGKRVAPLSRSSSTCLRDMATSRRAASTPISVYSSASPSSYSSPATAGWPSA